MAPSRRRKLYLEVLLVAPYFKCMRVLGTRTFCTSCWLLKIGCCLLCSTLQWFIMYSFLPQYFLSKSTGALSFSSHHLVWTALPSQNAKTPPIIIFYYLIIPLSLFGLHFLSLPLQNERNLAHPGRAVRQPNRGQVLGGDLQWARHQPHWQVQWRLRPPAQAHQCLLQRWGAAGVGMSKRPAPTDTNR